MSTRWGRGGDHGSYDEAWKRLEAQGQNPHGEADFVASYEPRTVLDAGCGTGRVAIELARRGIDVVGVDADPAMLDQARVKSPDGAWVEADLVTLDLGRTFDVVVAAGNVMIFLATGTEAAVVAAMARHLAPGGRLVVGFQLGRGYSLDQYDADATAAGLGLVERYATWDREPFAGGTYAISALIRGGAAFR